MRKPIVTKPCPHGTSCFECQLDDCHSCVGDATLNALDIRRLRRELDADARNDARIEEEEREV